MTTFIGKPVTLVGPQLRVGDVAPDFVLMANDLSLKSLKDFGKQTSPLPKNAGVALQVWKMPSPCLITMTMPLVNPTVCSCGSGICWRVRSLSSMPTMKSPT